MPTSTVRLSDDSNEDLMRLKAAVKAEFGLTARNEDIASALISGATVPQTAGMLLAYQRRQAALEAAETPAP
jgi:hypothetical protein